MHFHSGAPMHFHSGVDTNGERGFVLGENAREIPALSLLVVAEDFLSLPR